MSVSELIQKDTLEFSRLARKIIKSLDVYNKKAIQEILKSFGQENLKKDFKEKGSLVLVYKKDNKILGFLIGTLNNETGIAQIKWIGVKEDDRLNGVATELLKYFIKIGKESKNIHKIICYIVPGNNASLNFFKKHNFKKLIFLKKHSYKQDFFMFNRFL